ncbi:hypothetical protein FCV25MIE_19820, partial [Fagus crenata]
EVILKGLATAVALPLLVLKEAPPSSAKEVELAPNSPLRLLTLPLFSSKPLPETPRLFVQ